MLIAAVKAIHICCMIYFDYFLSCGCIYMDLYPTLISYSRVQPEISVSDAYRCA